MARGYLVLEDGTIYEGDLFGSTKECSGEVVFETGMDGYQESLTDPTSKGDILVMTYPIVGNYGIRDDFYQSDDVHVNGLVVREYCREPSPMYGGHTLEDFMIKHDVPGIEGIDTRDLVIKLRNGGTQRGMIVSDVSDVESIIAKIGSTASDGNPVSKVSCKDVVRYDNGKELTVGVLDFGVRNAVLEALNSRFNVIRFPYDTPADVIVESGVKGILLSNGPGDPSQEDVVRTSEVTVRDLTTQMPIYGLCFGSRVLARAMGATTYKMKFGHRGCSQPVKYGDRVYVTSQNHGFAVDENSLEGTGLVANQFNVNDGSVEGVRHRDLPIFTTDYHPEASPGPWDTTFIFDDFARMVKEGRL